SYLLFCANAVVPKRNVKTIIRLPLIRSFILFDLIPYIECRLVRSRLSERRPAYLRSGQNAPYSEVRCKNCQGKALLRFFHRIANHSRCTTFPKRQLQRGRRDEYALRSWCSAELSVGSCTNPPCSDRLSIPGSEFRSTLTCRRRHLWPKRRRFPAESTVDRDSCPALSQDRIQPAGPE